MLGIVTGLDLETKLCLKAFESSGRPVPLVICAAGTVEGAQLAARQIINKGATRLISFGVCGGLSPDVKSGDLIIPEKVMMEAETLNTDAGWVAKITDQTLDFRKGSIISVQTTVDTQEAKTALYQNTGALVVDVESFAVVQTAQQFGLPAIIIRAVLDPSIQSLPSSALNGVNEKGETQIWPVIKGLLRRPKELPDLIRLGSQNKHAGQTLTDFIKKAAF